MKQLWQVLCLALVLAPFGRPAVDPETKEVRKTVSLNRDGLVSVHTFKGSITVRSWDEPRVEIYARIEPDGSGRDWKEKVQDTEIRIDSSADSVRIESDYGKTKRRASGFWDHLFDWNDGTLPLVNYTIKMPRTARLRIKDYKSRSDVADFKSDVEIETYKGTVSISGLDGSLALKTYKGEVKAQFANLARRSRFETYKGEIEIVLPGDKGFELETDLGRHGTLDSNFEASLRVGKGFRGPVNGGGPELRLKSYKGTFRLRRA